MELRGNNSDFSCGLKILDYNAGLVGLVGGSVVETWEKVQNTSRIYDYMLIVLDLIFSGITSIMFTSLLQNCIIKQIFFC